MKTERQIKRIVTTLLKDRSLDLSGILKIAAKKKLTVGEAKQILKMLTFFSHNYIDNTTDWFEPQRYQPRVSDLEKPAYWIYMILGITFVDIKNSKGYYRRGGEDFILANILRERSMQRFANSDSLKNSSPISKLIISDRYRDDDYEPPWN